MRKSTLFMACCIGLMLLAGCKKKVAPTITLTQGEGYLTENAQVYANESYTVGFMATGEKLVELETKITKDGVLVSRSVVSIDAQPTYSYSSSISFDVTGTLTVTGIVKDADGQTALTSFNVICEEKPNARFVGNYEGNALATGFYEAEVSGMEPIQQEFTDREVPVILDVVAGEGLYDVVATCTIDERTMTVTGTVEGNTVTFETFNDVITFDYDLGIMVIHPEINVTYTIVGTLVDGKLNLEGNCTGNGDMNYGFFSGTINLEAVVGGSLNKTTR